jgi:hypothetical protein
MLLLVKFIPVSLCFQFEKYMSQSKLKYYFAVDTAYVGKKLGLLVFPYTHQVSILVCSSSKVNPWHGDQLIDNCLLHNDT